MPFKPLIALFGPTAVGKTDTAIRLAHELNGEVVNADSRQFYREISIGTAKPTLGEMQGIAHHFVDNLSIHDAYSAGQFGRDALQIISGIHAKGALPILSGGSGLHIRAVLGGFDSPPADAKLRSELQGIFETAGMPGLHELLKLHNPDVWEKIDSKNPVRVIRAIEIGIATAAIGGKPPHAESIRDFTALKIGLELPRNELYERINRRVDAMMASGLLREATTYASERQLQAFHTVGYRELFMHIDGTLSLEEAVEKIKMNTRRYAKRQLTWMRGEAGLHRFHPDETTDIIEFVKHWLSEQT